MSLENLAREYPRVRLQRLQRLQKEKNITTKEKRFDLSSIYIIDVPFPTASHFVTPQSLGEVTEVTSPFDGLSQALGVTNTNDLEHQVVDFLKRYGDFGIKHVAKKLKKDEQDIRQIAQNSALIEYRKSNFDGVVYESLLLKEVNYPARFVIFVELRRDLTIDDILKMLEECESFIKHHDKDHLEEWVKFCTRFVDFYRDGDNPIATLRTALVYQEW